MKNIIDYQVIIEKQYLFNEIIKEMIKEWYQPYWFIFISEREWYLCQSMVKYE